MNVKITSCILCVALLGLFASDARAGQADTGFKRVNGVQINTEVGGNPNDHMIKVWLQDTPGDFYYRSSNTGEIALIESLVLTALSTGRTVKIIYSDEETGDSKEIGSIIIR